MNYSPISPKGLGAMFHDEGFCMGLADVVYNNTSHILEVNDFDQAFIEKYTLFFDQW